MINYEEDKPMGDLGEIAELAKELKIAKINVAGLEEQLKRAKETVRKIEEDLLPSAMSEIGGVGMTEFALSDGSRIQLKKALHMSIPKKNMPDVCRWLIDGGNGSLVRTEISANFGAGQSEEAQRAHALLEQAGVPNMVSTAVNTTSLKALVKELLGEGQDVPLKMMGGYEREYAEITTG